MSEVTVRIHFRRDDGKIEDAALDFDLSTFGGFLPSVGDVILDPLVLQGHDRSDPKSRNIWTVVGRFFNPRDLNDYVALIVEERSPLKSEETFVP